MKHPDHVFSEFGSPPNDAHVGNSPLSSFGGFDENTFDFWRILVVLKKWWMLILCLAILSTALVASIVMRVTPVYMASSIMEIKKKERQIFDVSEVGNAVFDREFFVTQIELLKSATLAENVVNSLNLSADPYFTSTNNSGDVNRKNRAIRVFSSKLHIKPIGNSRLIKVSFEHTDPRKAALIANAVSDTFISYNMERKYNATSYARDFIEDRLKITKDVLEKSERNLVQYASDNNLLTVGGDSGEATHGFLDSVALVDLSRELTAAQSTSNEYKKKYSLAKANFNAREVMESTIIVSLKNESVKLNTEYLENLSLFKIEYPMMVELKKRIDYLDAQLEMESSNMQETILSEIKAEYEIALENERSLKIRVSSLKINVANIRDKSIDYNILKREVDTNRTQYDALLQRLKEVSISDDIGSNLISLIDRAKTPRTPFKPNKRRSLILAFLVGSILGTGLAFGYELVDDRIKAPEDIKTKLKSTIMGVIPKSSDVKNITNLLCDPQSSIAESYASVRTNLQFSGPSGGPKVIHLTSTRSGEGKSVSALGLALRFAGLQEKTLLIDADMRLPTFVTHEAESIGLSGLLTSNEDPGAHIQKTNHQNLDLLSSGALVPNPSEILSTYRLEEILDYARQHYDHVIVDSPPVLGIADALILSVKCDATLLVVESSAIRTPAIKSTIERLQVGSVKLIGVILTKYTAPTKGYLNYYQYSYGEAANQYGGKAKKSKTAKNKQLIDIV